MKKEIYKEKLELKEVSIDNDVPFFSINCPSCNEQVTADNVDLAKAVAKCGSCHVLFPIGDTLAKLSQTKVEEPLLLPAGVEAFEYKDQLEISLSNPNSNTWVDGIMVFLAIVLPSFIFMYSIISIDKGVFSMTWFGSGLFLFMFPLYWFFSVRKKNKILFSVYQNKLSIEHRPNYLKKAKRFDIDSIQQFYVKGNSLLVVVDDFGKRKDIKIHTSTDTGLLKYLEKTLENHLRIEDKKYD